MKLWNLKTNNTPKQKCQPNRSSFLFPSNLFKYSHRRNYAKIYATVFDITKWMWIFNFKVGECKLCRALETLHRPLAHFSIC